MEPKNYGVGELKEGARIIRNEMLGIRMFGGFFLFFFLPLLEQKLVINLTVLRTIHFLLQAKKRNLRHVISLVTQSNNVIQSGNQYYRY